MPNMPFCRWTPEPEGFFYGPTGRLIPITRIQEQEKEQVKPAQPKTNGAIEEVEEFSY